MRKSAFTLYYQAARSILINDFEGARSYIKQNPKMWMQEALTTELLVKENRKKMHLVMHATLFRKQREYSDMFYYVLGKENGVWP